MGRYYFDKIVRVRHGRITFECVNFDDPTDRSNVSITRGQLRKLEDPRGFFSKEDIETHFRKEN